MEFVATTILGFLTCLTYWVSRNNGPKGGRPVRMYA